MFNNPSKIDSGLDEGFVTEVDPIRRVCKVKTLKGQNLDDVFWLSPVGGSDRSGDRTCPTMGNRVVVSHGLGHPVIIGSLPRVDIASNTFPMSIDTGEAIVDTGNFTSAGVNAVGDQNKPKDMLSGDRILTSIGGAMLGLLRGGSILLRSSRLAEIFISKWNDLVRIVSRNFEHFTDTSSDVCVDLSGRTYRYTGYTNTFSAGANENYTYHLYYGDTALAEAVKTNYMTQSTGPSFNGIIFKEQVSGTGGELYSRTLATSGFSVTTIGAMIVTHTNALYTIAINGTIITVTADQIDLKHSGGAEATYDANGIIQKFNGGVSQIDSSGVKHTYGGHYVNVTSGGVQMG